MLFISSLYISTNDALNIILEEGTMIFHFMILISNCFCILGCQINKRLPSVFFGLCLDSITGIILTFLMKSFKERQYLLAWNLRCSLNFRIYDWFVLIFLCTLH